MRDIICRNNNKQHHKNKKFRKQKNNILTHLFFFANLISIKLCNLQDKKMKNLITAISIAILLMFPEIVSATISIHFKSIPNPDGTYDLLIDSATSNAGNRTRDCSSTCRFSFISRLNIPDFYAPIRQGGGNVTAYREDLIAQVIVGSRIKNINVNGNYDPVNMLIYLKFNERLPNGFTVERSERQSDSLVTFEHELTRCSIREGDFQLDHGSLSEEQLNGDIKSLMGNVSCNNPASIKITAFSSESKDSLISLTPGLTALLKINNTDGKIGVTMNNVTNTSFTLYSILKTSSPVAAGVYRGSGILNLDFE